METQTQESARVMSVGDWVVTLILCAIPLVNIIMLCVWGFGENENPNRRNFSRAYLIMLAIVIGIWLLVVMTVGTAIMGAIGEI